MSAARDILHRLADLGATVERQGDKLMVRAGNVAVSRDILTAISEHRGEVMAALAPPASPEEQAHRWFAAEAEAAALAKATGLDITELGRDWPASAWRRLYAARIAFWSLPRSDAYDNVTRRLNGHWIAWGDLQNRWHKRHGERPAAGLCAGCGEPIGDAEALTLSGYQTHLGRDPDCLMLHGGRWRNAADAGLKAMGLTPPTAAPPEG